MHRSVFVLPLLLLAACSAGPADGDAAPSDAAAAASTAPSSGQAGTPDAAPGETASDTAPGDTLPTQPTGDAPAFVDRVWRVGEGGSVEAGTTYVFLSDGTLVVDAPHGTPMQGEWSRDGKGLVMVEEGVSYPTDIVTLEGDRFVFRSHNPGGAVTVDLRAVPGAPLPQAR